MEAVVQVSKSRWSALAAIVLALALGVPAQALALDAAPPAAPVKLVFIHHSTGGAWLGTSPGGLGSRLKSEGYFVSDTNYGWGPSVIGDSTDVGHWWTWFRGPDAATYTAALFAESGQNCSYDRLAADPGGENQIVMFKSCFPNSNVGGSPSDAVPAIGSNPLRGAGSPLTVGNAKGIYLDLLEYFKTRPDKLFVLIVSPPLRSAETNASAAANARYLANWLVDPNGWLKDYPLTNVAVFDYFTVLTGGHHRVWNGAIEHTAGASDYLIYPTGDSHPSPEGHAAASVEFAPLLNVAYNRWKASPTPVPTPPTSLGTPFLTKRARRNVRFTVAGTLSPATGSARTVRLYVQRKVGRKWRSYRAYNAVVAAGSTGYGLRLRLSSTGSYRVRTRHLEGAKTLWSGYRAFTVRRR
jgi:hypothetical protein